MKSNEKVLNYCKQIIETIGSENNLKLIRKKGRDSFPYLISLLSKSVKFILPDRGEIIDTYKISNNEEKYTFKKEWRDLMNIPFPVTAFEIPFSYTTDEVLQKDGLMEQVRASKRVALCWDPKHPLDEIKEINKIVAEYSLFYGENFYKIGEEGSPDGFCITTFFYDDNKGYWTIIPGGGFFPYEINQENNDNDGIAGAIINLYPHLLNYLRVNIYAGSIDSCISQIWNDLNPEVWSILQACAVLNCENVKVRKIRPPEKLQKSRNRKGLPALHEYNVLEIATKKESNDYLGNEIYGNRGSKKRTHLRRGHLRRIASGRAIWVRSSVVGSGSVKEKSYLIKG